MFMFYDIVHVLVSKATADEEGGLFILITIHSIHVA